MKYLSILLLTLMVLGTSCKTVKDLIVKEEKIEIVNQKIEKQTYYVIIGSFKEKSNADKYLLEMRKKQFVPVLLRNSDGLYRVTVFSTNYERSARTKILSIRQKFDEHKDVWLLISK